MNSNSCLSNYSYLSSTEDLYQTLKITKHTDILIVSTLVECSSAGKSLNLAFVKEVFFAFLTFLTDALEFVCDKR